MNQLIPVILWLLLFSLAFAGPMMAQSLSDWVDQKKTQIDELQKQIAALEAYKTVLEKGSEIAGKGLATIEGIKQGDLDLHTEHFASLGTVKDVVAQDPRVGAALDLSVRIKKISGELAAELKIQAIRNTDISEHIIYLCNSSVDHLSEITRNGDLKMTDDERLETIDQIYQDLKNLYLCELATFRDIRKQYKLSP